jgi:hypothetical protein
MTLERAITSALQRQPARAMFVTELRHALGGHAEGTSLDAALHALTQSGDLIVVDKPPPDAHLRDIDLRIVAVATPAASEAVETVWRDFVREFLASHRCS